MIELTLVSQETETSRPPTPARRYGELSAHERLEQLLPAFEGMGGAGLWLAHGVRRFLDGDARTLDRALGLTVRGAHPLQRRRLAARDRALCELAADVLTHIAGPVTERAVANLVAARLRRVARRAVRTANEPDHLAEAVVVLCGRSPISPERIRAVLRQHRARLGWDIGGSHDPN